MRSREFCQLVLLLIAGGLALEAQAQQLGRVDLITSNAGTYFYFVEPGEATIQVSAIGAVRQPGLYEVGVGTDLHKLLSLSGGPRLDPRSSRVQAETRILLYRQGASYPIYSAALDETVTRRHDVPLLQEGDALMVEVIERERFTWRAIRVVGGIATVVLIARYIDDLAN